jgi:O-antigen/teichoic acid export membrane protein
MNPLVQTASIAIDPRAQGVEPKQNLPWLRRFISEPRVLALIDQAVVSATSFVTTIMLGRWTDAGQLGFYALAMSALVSVIAVQESLISYPYSIQRHRPLGTPAEHAGNALVHSGVLSVGSICVMAATSLILSSETSQLDLVAISLALAAIIPFALSREFARRFAFARLRIAEALILDISVATIQLTALGWLGWTGRLSAVTAFLAIGTASSVAVAGWFYFACAEFAIRRDLVKGAFWHSWPLGKWLFVGQLTVQVQYYCIYWVVAAIAGTAVTGIYAACISVVAFANPLIVGVRNILTPRLVLAWINGGGAGLRRQTIRDTLLLGAIMATFCVVILIAGEDVLRLLYPGSEYDGQGHTLRVLALATLISALGMPASSALASMGRPRAIAAVGAVTAVLTVVFVWFLMLRWDLLGAAYGFLTGNVVGTLGRWAAFLIIIPRAFDPTLVTRVLGAFTGNPDDVRCEIKRIGEGDYATVYSVQSETHQAVSLTHPNLAIKMYKSDVGINLTTLNAQFEALSQLYMALDGRSVFGWAISIPKPLFICRTPLALVMTKLTGKDLESYTSADYALSRKALYEIGRTVAAAMNGYWAQGKIHGDFAFRNILVQIPDKSISFLDPGTPESCCVCNSDTKHWDPAILDLAHVLWDLGTHLRETIVNPTTYLRRQVLADSLFSAYLETIATAQDKQRQLDFIEACTLAHLSKRLQISLSARGARNWLVKNIAKMRTAATLRRLRAELDILAVQIPNPKSLPIGRASWVYQLENRSTHGQRSAL